MQTRRSFIRMAAGGIALADAGLVGRLARAELPQGTMESQLLDTLPGKQRLIKRSFRPPNYESPLQVFGDVVTPNAGFFVRWHLANIPRIDAGSWRLDVGGDAAERGFKLSMDELKREFEPVELLAVCQCAGNQRGFSAPHVPGVQWGSGAMGNARWKGVRLKDILARAGLKKNAVEIAFNGGDVAPIERTPAFVKSLPAWKAMDENTLVAYEMNGAALPHWNGFPARIVVPGWAATYWMKQVQSIRALSQPLASFWMNTAYRIPLGKFPIIDRFTSQESATTTPITEILVNSLITNLGGGRRFAADQPIEIKGIAWDGGYGIRGVEISVDDGRTWQSAKLGENLGKYSFRAWQYTCAASATGRICVMARAGSVQGTSQPSELIFNGAGYHNNVVQRIAIDIV
ncbi:MAG: molybdopterin-dependent oxidoreductase [Steroidobacteraceae bacterium]